MAELILKVGAADPASLYHDGDVVVAPNDRRIGCVHIDHICDVRKTGFNGDGLRPDSIAREQQELVYQFKFERISAKEVRRTNLVTLDQDVLTDVPNAKGEAIAVSLFLKRRKAHANHRIFGTDGAEFWYGGRIDATKSKVDTVWQMIEGNTANRRVDHSKFPLGTVDVKHFLALSVGDYDDPAASAYTSEYAFDEDSRLSRRICSVDWQDLDDIAGPIKNQIANRSVSVDVRDHALYAAEDIVSFKGFR